MSMTLVLYNFTGDDTDVDKASGLTQILSLSGELRNETDVCHPSFIVDAKATDINGVNYAYVAAWNRYYFLRKRTVINPGGSGTGQNGTFRIDLDVDVLYSYKTNILNEYALVARCAYSSYREATIFDKEIPIRSERNHNKYTFTNNPLVTHRSPEFQVHYNYCLVTASKEHTTQTTTSHTNGSGTGYLPSLFVQNYEWLSSNQSIQTAYAMTNDELSRFLDYLVSDRIDASLARFLQSAGGSSVINIVGYPFDLDKSVDILGVPAQVSKIAIGDGYATFGPGTTDFIYGKLIGKNYLGYLDFGSVDLSQIPSDFTYYEPVSEYYAFLPYIGTVHLNAADLVGTTIALAYLFDVTTGSGNAVLYNPDTNRIIATYAVRLGWNIPIQSTNKDEITRNMLMGGIQMAVGAVSMASGNPMGVVPLSQGVTSAIQTGILNRPQYTGTLGEGRINANIDPQAYIIRSRANAMDPVNFATSIGYPCNQYLLLSTFTGHGYVRVGEIHPHHYSGATNEEMDQIISLLKSGVHF